MSDDSDASNISSDSSDSNFFMDKPKINNTNFLEEIVPSYDDDKFFHHFRLSRESVDIIVENFEASEHYKDSSGQYGNISSRNQVLIVLWYIGHMSSFRDVANRFDITISSVHRILRRVVFTISNLAPSIITWPTNEEKIESERYFCQNGFPMVIGAIDGIHIKIDKPLEDSDCYKNKKGYYSIQMQAVCNHNRKIIDLFVGYPGSVNDSRVFRNSSLFNKLEEKCGNYFILADRGYPLKPNVLTPFKDKGNLTDRQKNYNKQLSKSRYVIEHCFELLKKKFKQLYHLKSRSVTFIVHFIRAACVLHNIALGDVIHIEENENANEAIENHDENGSDDEDDGDINAQNIRNRIVNMLT